MPHCRGAANFLTDGPRNLSLRSDKSLHINARNPLLGWRSDLMKSLMECGPGRRFGVSPARAGAVMGHFELRSLREKRHERDRSALSTWQTVESFCRAFDASDP